VNLETLRILAAFGGALLLAVILGDPFMRGLRRLGLGQHIREEGPQSHWKKAGTLTMGGIIILTALTVVLAVVGALRGFVIPVLLATWGYGLLGLADDVLSVTRGRNMGLKARQKLLGQIVLGILVGYFAHRAGLGRDLPVPFWAGRISLGPFFMIGLSTLAMVSAANGVNLTDGLDGLAAGAVAATAMAQAALAALFGQFELAVFAAAVAGSCLGFLWHNAHPAAVFMGDTGSLALGGALGALAIFSQTTFFLPLLAGLFVLETLSVILQVASFQATGKRILRMSPLHHHFELGGWPETKVVVRFWLLGAIFGLIGLMAARAAYLG